MLPSRFRIVYSAFAHTHIHTQRTTRTRTRTHTNIENFFPNDFYRFLLLFRSLPFFFPDLWYKKHTHTNSVPDDLPFFFRSLLYTTIHWASDHCFELIVFLAYICICRWSRNKLLMNVARDDGIHLVSFIHWWKCVEAFRICTKAGSGEWNFISAFLDWLIFFFYCEHSIIADSLLFNTFQCRLPIWIFFFAFPKNFLLLQFRTNFNLSLLVIFNLPQTRSLSTHTRNCSPHSAKHFSVSLFSLSFSFVRFLQWMQLLSNFTAANDRFRDT